MFMKTKLIFCAAIAFLTVSCAKEQLPVQNEPAGALVVTATVEQPATKTSLNGLSVNWTVDDQIAIYDDSGKSAIYKATTAAANTSFQYVSGDTDLSGTVYAYYPAANVASFSAGAFTVTLPDVQPYNANGFADGINPMTAMASIVDGGVALSFKNVLSIVKVQITDSENNKTLTGISLSSATANLCGTATVTVGESGIATTSITEDSKSIEVSNVYASLSSVAFPIYVAVPAGDLGNITITAKTSESTGSYSQTKTSSSSLTATRSNIYAYNPMAISGFTDKTAESQPAANCYMVNSAMSTIIIPLSQATAGWNAIKALEPSDNFDMAKITSGTRSIDVRWLDGTAGTITLSAIDAEKMTLSLSGCPTGGNAVVDLKNDSDIVWSWHLWFTDYIPGADDAHTTAGKVHSYSGAAFQSGGKYYGKVMMDRNLGATATGVREDITQPTTDAAAKTFWGLHYQFGRKEPFSQSVEPTKVNVTSAKKTYAYAAQHPTEFYYTATSADAWSSTDATMTDPWNSTSDTKSAFDPCPAGWRIPVNGTTANSNVFTGITTSTWKSAYSSISATCGQLWCNAWFPAAGYRSASSGSLGRQGTNVFYWGAPRTTGAGYYAYFYSSNASTANPTNGSRASGLSVRCVKE